MTTSPYGGTDPLEPPPPPATTPTPIGDELARDRGFPTGIESSSSAEDSGSGRAQEVKEQAQDALGTAAEQGSQVAGTAKDEALSVAAEAKDKATDLLADVKSQVDEQSKAQLRGLAAKVGELADEIENLVSGSEATGTVAGVAQQLADKTHELSSHLESRQPLDLLEDVRGFARRRPGTFLAGAAVAGVVAGRLTRGAKASQDSTSQTSTGPTSSSSALSGTGASSSSTTTTPVSTAAGPSTGSLVGDAASVPPGQNTGGRP